MCLACGVSNDMHTQVDGGTSHAPREGDFTVCASCGTPARFKNGGETATTWVLQPCDGADMADLTPRQVGLLLVMARALKAEAESEALRAAVARVREACEVESFAVDDRYRMGYETAKVAIRRALDGGAE